MVDYIDAPKSLVTALDTSFLLGPIIEGTKRDFTEASLAYIHPHIKVSTFSKEHEPPHFRLDYQQQNCRYDLFTGEPIDSVPKKIKKYSKNIREWYNEHRDTLIDFYKKNLADDAPPQAKIHN